MQKITNTPEDQKQHTGRQKTHQKTKNTLKDQKHRKTKNPLKDQKHTGRPKTHRTTKNNTRQAQTPEMMKTKNQTCTLEDKNQESQTRNH